MNNEEKFDPSKGLWVRVPKGGAARKPPPDPTTDSGRRRNLGIIKESKEATMQILEFKMGITKEEVAYALDKMSSPYSQKPFLTLVGIGENESSSKIIFDDDTVFTDSDIFSFFV